MGRKPGRGNHVSQQHSELVRDLERVLTDTDNLGAVPTSDSGVHAYAPAVMLKIRDMLGTQGRHRFSGTRHFRSINKLLQNWHDLLGRHVDLVRERQVWHEESNVVVSTPWDALAAATSSSTVEVGAPYSGIRFMLLDILVPAELNPRGRLTSFTFAGINFAQPSTSSTTVGYSTAAGVLGTPAVLGMDLTVFYQNKTAPIGRRGFRPWTGWIFDPSAKINVQIHNPDPALARSYDLAWLMRSSPCNETFDPQKAMHNYTGGESFQTLADQIHGAVIGIGQGALPRPGYGGATPGGVSLMRR